MAVVSIINVIYVKCLCVWPVIINGFGMCYTLNVCVCQWPVWPSLMALVSVIC